MADPIILKIETPTPIKLEVNHDGLSAYEIALKNGFVGTEEEWLISLTGTPDMTYKGLIQLGSSGIISSLLQEIQDGKGNATGLEVSTSTFKYTGILNLATKTASSLLATDASKNVVSVTNSTGWLYNDGAGTFTYSIPTKSDIGLSNVENTALSTWAGTTNLTTLGIITAGKWHGSQILETYGGTNQTSYTTGDLLYASSANTLSKLGIGSAGQYLKVVAGVPSWATISASASLSGLTAATATNTIDNLNFAQEWDWSTLTTQKALRLYTAGGNTLTTGTLLSIESGSTAYTTGNLLSVALTGSNAASATTTAAASFSNTRTGTTSTNIAASFTASGATNNQAILITAGDFAFNYNNPKFTWTSGTINWQYSGSNILQILTYGVYATKLGAGGNVDVSNNAFQVRGASYFGNDTNPPIASARVHIVHTTEQLRLGYDVNNYFKTTIDASANATLALTAGSGTPVFTFSNSITLADAKNLAFGTTTGSLIGVTSSQKIGIWGKTPIIQPTTAFATAVHTAVGGAAINDLDTFNGYTVAQVMNILFTMGILA